MIFPFLDPKNSKEISQIHHEYHQLWWNWEWCLFSLSTSIFYMHIGFVIVIIIITSVTPTTVSKAINETNLANKGDLCWFHKLAICRTYKTVDDILWWKEQLQTIINSSWNFLTFSSFYCVTSGKNHPSIISDRIYLDDWEWYWHCNSSLFL